MDLVKRSRSNQDVLKLTNVSKTFEVKNEAVKVLRDVSVTIKRNSFTILYGPSGSGKSTLLNILAGLEPPTSGHVTFRGQDIYSLTANQRASYRALYLGVVYQSNYWINSLTTLENVASPAYLLGTRYRQGLKMAKEALHKVNMNDYSTREPNLLSSGQQQRIQLARALVTNPSVIIADEPTGNLDTSNGDMVMNLLAKCRSEYGQTIILATHNLEYLPLSDSQIYVKDGIVEQNFGEHRWTGGPTISLAQFKKMAKNK